MNRTSAAEVSIHAVSPVSTLGSGAGAGAGAGVAVAAGSAAGAAGGVSGACASAVIPINSTAMNKTTIRPTRVMNFSFEGNNGWGMNKLKPHRGETSSSWVWVLRRTCLEAGRRYQNVGGLEHCPGV